MAGALIAASSLLAVPPVCAQPPAHRSAQPRGHQPQGNAQRTERNRYEWRRNRYVIARPPAGPIKSLPKNHVTVRIGDRHYYEHQGRYYDRRSGGFVLVAPPIGLVVATLPVGAINIHIGGVVYFLAGGVYYRHAPQGYVVVTAPQPAPDVVYTGVRRVVIQAAVLNVRSGPGLEFTVIARVERGVSLAVFGSGPGWYYVRLPDGQYGWVMTQYTIPVNLEPAG